MRKNVKLLSTVMGLTFYQAVYSGNFAADHGADRFARCFAQSRRLMRSFELKVPARSPDREMIFASRVSTGANSIGRRRRGVNLAKGACFRAIWQIGRKSPTNNRFISCARSFEFPAHLGF
jgi:hypothetical protein